jgi:SAM-dependent methyltransferase
MLSNTESRPAQTHHAEIVNAVEDELKRHNHALKYFELLRFDYLDDLARIDKLYRGGPVLEIGGFPFCFSLCLQRLGTDLFTVDLAPWRAKEIIERHSLRVIQHDIEWYPLPFAADSFEMVTLCATFEHLRIDPLFTLEEIGRVLRPDGVLYLTTPNLYRLGNILSFVLGRGLAFDPIHEYGKLRTVGHMGHVREYTSLEMRRFLHAAGFTSVHLDTRAMPSQRGKIVDLVHRFAPKLRGEHVVIASSCSQ